MWAGEIIAGQVFDPDQLFKYDIKAKLVSVLELAAGNKELDVQFGLRRCSTIPCWFHSNRMRIQAYSR